MDQRGKVAGDDDIQRIRGDSEDEKFRRQASRNEGQRERVERSNGNSRNRFKRQQENAPPPKLTLTETLLTEIRDQLRARPAGPGGGLLTER